MRHERHDEDQGSWVSESKPLSGVRSICFVSSGDPNPWTCVVLLVDETFKMKYIICFEECEYFTGRHLHRSLCSSHQGSCCRGQICRTRGRRWGFGTPGLSLASKWSSPEKMCLFLLSISTNVLFFFSVVMCDMLVYLQIKATCDG